MLVDEVLRCSFQNWYDKFKAITPKSIILPVPEGFTKYLIADGIVLPESCDKYSSSTSHGNKNIDDDDDQDDTNWDSSDEDDENATAAKAPDFKEFNEKIAESISKLGGKVFPKLNWSSPQDASWIGVGKSCCCTSVTDIYLLLKSSDFITHDITNVFDLCEDFNSGAAAIIGTDQSLTSYHLILKEWIEINPINEFRCFVKNGSLIGITQRDLSTFADYIMLQREDIIQDIESFFNDHIKYRFQLNDYVFDVVREKRDNIILLDFNPFGKPTDSLLFDWSELHNFHVNEHVQSTPMYRCIETNMGIQPQPFSYYAIPKDIIDISTGVDTDKFVDFLKLNSVEQNYSSDEER